MDGNHKFLTWRLINSQCICERVTEENHCVVEPPFDVHLQ
jgi:hypothetical protein